MRPFFTLLGKQTNVIDDANLKGFYFTITIKVQLDTQNIQNIPGFILRS